jgi:hypothetical protein
MALQSIVALETITLPSPSSQVEFRNIPQNYRDLVLLTNVSSTSNDNGMILRFNSDSGSNYSSRSIFASASSGGFETTTTHALFYSIQIGSNSSGILTPVVGQFLDYSSTNKHKTILTKAYGRNNTSHQITSTVSRWANNAAVTSVTVLINNGIFDTGSTFSLYGRIG